MVVLVIASSALQLSNSVRSPGVCTSTQNTDCSPRQFKAGDHKAVMCRCGLALMYATLQNIYNSDLRWIQTLNLQSNSEVSHCNIQCSLVNETVPIVLRTDGMSN